MSKHPTIDGLIRSLHAAADGGGGAWHHRDTMLEAAETIDRLRDFLKPFSKEADEYDGWDAGAVLSVTDNGNSEPRETWYTVADLRAARAICEGR